VDDSIVRGTTSKQIVQMARDAGANKVFFASAAPPVRFPNVYGIDMPSRDELLATGRSDEEICREIGADALIYQDLDDLVRDIQQSNPAIRQFDTSCFNGCYVTGDITETYLAEIESARGDGSNVSKPANSSTQLDLNLVGSSSREEEEAA
jgi:amidophosphoribosyltransferase